MENKCTTDTQIYVQWRLHRKHISQNNNRIINIIMYIAAWKIHYCTYYLNVSFNDIQLSRTRLSRNATLYYRNVNCVSWASIFLRSIKNLMDQLTITICNKKVSECLIQGTKISFGLPYKSFSFIHPNEIYHSLLRDIW